MEPVTSDRADCKTRLTLVLYRNAHGGGRVRQAAAPHHNAPGAPAEVGSLHSFLSEDVGKYLDQVLDAILRVLAPKSLSRGLASFWADPLNRFSAGAGREQATEARSPRCRSSLRLTRVALLEADCHGVIYPCFAISARTKRT